jgi:hypothetical protein
VGIKSMEMPLEAGIKFIGILRTALNSWECIGVGEYTSSECVSGWNNIHTYASQAGIIFMGTPLGHARKSWECLSSVQ